MPQYTRAYLPGGTYFFTVALLERRRALLVEHIDDLRAAFRAVRMHWPFRTEAIVVLPDHLHCIWTLPAGDADFSNRWFLIKRQFLRGIPRGEPLSRRRQVKGERGIWQRRFWEHVIRDEDDFAAHVDYIHYNPVKHGHVHRVADWPHSSFHRFVAKGTLPADWAAGPAIDALDYE